FGETGRRRIIGKDPQLVCPRYSRNVEMPQLHKIAHSISRDVNTHSRSLLGTFVIDECNSYWMIIGCENIVRSEIAVDIATEMQSGYFRAEPAKDTTA